MGILDIRGKPASAWNTADIADLAGAQEGQYLEFKKPREFMDGGALKLDRCRDEICESISAFLNADGGTILIGVQTDLDLKGETKKNLKTPELLRPPDKWTANETFEAFGVKLGMPRVRDWIYSNLGPRPFGLDVAQVDLPIPNGHTAILVVTVKSSDTGAHQYARTGVYYQRRDASDEPMLDHEIRAVNSRRAGPVLYLRLGLRGGTEELRWVNDSGKRTSVGELKVLQDSPGGPRIVIEIRPYVQNFGRGTASVARFDMGVPHPWSLQPPTWPENFDLARVLGTEVTVRIPSHRTREWEEEQICWLTAIHRSDGPGLLQHPIWPSGGEMLPLAPQQLTMLVESRRPRQGYATGDPFYFLPWRILAEGMEQIRGIAHLELRGDNCYLTNYEVEEVGWGGLAEGEEVLQMLRRRFPKGG